MEPTKTKSPMRKRRRFTPEFKAGAERLVREEPASTILLSYADTEKGRAEAEREKALKAGGK